MAYMPTRLKNGNEAARLLDLLGYTPREISQLFLATRTFDVCPTGRRLYADFEDVFADISKLEKTHGNSSVAFYLEAPALYEQVEARFAELSDLLKLEELAEPYPSIGKLKLWLNGQLPHGLPEHMQAM